MTREELKEHCEKQVEACLDWHKVSGKPLGKVYEEHKLVLDLLDQDADKEKRLEELLESLQTANKTNETLIKLFEGKQEPTSEWQQDHAILKAHSDGANEVIDRVKQAREELAKKVECYSRTGNREIEAYKIGLEDALEFFDKLIAESEGKE